LLAVVLRANDTVEGSYADAVRYVATTPTSGLAQYALLCSVGLKQSDSIVEIGCGALHFAKVALAVGHPYGGIDPNTWLADAAIAEDPVLAQLAQRARFSARDDFDIRAAFGRTWDWLFAHSVLSHASRAGLRQFLRESFGAADKMLVSVNLVSTPVGSIGDQWMYPGAVTIGREEFSAAMEDAGWAVWEELPSLRALYRSWCPEETHDWVLASA
jgi:hypothetical protein